jgi:transcriptional regulator with XRE-family HTH domain
LPPADGCVRRTLRDSTDFNQRVGSNVQKFRKAAGLSQADLAHALSQRGASFQQQTVLKVEKGSRPLKLDEAVLIADILKMPMFDLLIMRADAGELVEAALELNKANEALRRLQARRGELAGELEQLNQEMAQAEAVQREASERFEAAAGDDDGTR